MSARMLILYIYSIFCTSSFADFSFTDTAQDNINCDGLTLDNFKFKLNLGVTSQRLRSEPVNQCFCNTLDQKRYGIINCFSCDQDANKCKIYGTCCPPDDQSPPVAMKCQSSRETAYLTINSCPADYHNHSTRVLCERDLLLNEITPEAITITTDIERGASYTNKYCAECNGAQQTCKWQLNTECLTFYHVRGALTEIDFLRLSSKKSSKCNLYQIPCTNQPYKCDPRFYYRGVDYRDRCNSSGNEVISYSGTSVEQACQDQPFMIQSVVVLGFLTFKNIFCLICNRKAIHIRNTRTDPWLTPPFQYMFGLDNSRFSHEPDSNATMGCPSHQWMDPAGNCRKLLCAEGKVLRSNHCETAITRITGLAYRLSLMLVSLGHYKISGPAFNYFGIDWVKATIRDELLLPLAPVIDRTSVAISVTLHPQALWSGPNVSLAEEEPCQDCFLLPQFVLVNAILSTKTGMARDDVENSLLSAFLRPTLHIRMKDYYNSSYQHHFMYNFSDYFKENDPCKLFSNLSCPSSHYGAYESNGRLAFMTGRANVNSLMTGLDSSETIEIHKHLECPFVELAHQYIEENVNPWPIPHITKIVVRFGSRAVAKISKVEEIQHIYRQENEEVFYICQELLESKFRFQPLTTSRLSGVIQYIITIICVTASLVCLCATIITYSLFPSLRNVAGCNMMGLSSSLLIAQTLLVVANRIQGPSTACTTFGVISHYSWLVMFTWMFLCCLHTLRVFTSINLNAASSTEKSERKTVSMYVTLSLLIPALVVIVIVVTNVVMYDRTRIGYGHYSCGVDSVFATYGPLIFVILCNTVFFIIVVTKIWNTRRLQQNEEYRKDFIVYMKLSTLTGTFWILVILGEVFQNDIVRCFAIIFNGCQGVFLFTSFMANHRVMECYKEKFHFGRGASSASVTGSSSISEGEMSMPKNIENKRF